MLKISLKSLKVKIFRAYLVPLINCPRQIHFTLLQWFLGITQKYESCVSFNLLSPKIVLVSPKKSNCCFLWPWGSCFRDSKAFFRFFFFRGFWGLLLWNNIGWKWNKSLMSFTQNILLLPLKKWYKTCFLQTSS